MKSIFLGIGFGFLAASALADPQITSWFTVDATKPAQIYRTEAEKSAGQTETTWSNGRNTQAQPTGCGVQEILSSSNWVYIRSTGLGSQVMGPWQSGRFPNLPTDQHYIYAISRHPVAQAGHAFNRLNEIGMFVDGVRMFDANDAFSYSNGSGRDGDPRAGIGQGDRIWNRDALVNEGRTLDASLGHQQNWGRYHYHAEPLALRYLLGDHVDFDAATKTYHESTGAVLKHSPILGWMQDGYPIYGPYGYANPTNAASGVRRMVSGFVIRNGENNTDNLIRTGRQTLPAWEARENNRSVALQSTETGPAVNETYPLGHYIEDYAYLGDTGQVMGRNFDLDELNGRWCVTPEYPQGTYAYFTTIDAAGKPAYPYNMGRRYHGYPNGRLVNGIHEAVVTNFTTHATLVVKTMDGAAKTTTLTWNGDKGYGAETK
ncbi:MAG TPA: YHYH protein [Verrucomicrobiae bacterium]|nr:YHYH protein [Verrucomicrobiae bacterium]